MMQFCQGFFFILAIEISASSKTTNELSAFLLSSYLSPLIVYRVLMRAGNTRENELQS